MGIALLHFVLVFLGIGMGVEEATLIDTEDLEDDQDDKDDVKK